MKMTGNTILITGGGSGIGRALAEAFHRRGNQVVIAGRRQATLDEVTAANPGMRSAPLNIEDPAAVELFAAKLATDYPSLNVIVNNAGIMRPEKVVDEHDLSDAESMVATNLLGPIRLTTALLPLLRRQPSSTVMTVSSGLAFVPLTVTPTYSATKAAVHSYSQSLRHQLKDTPVRVVELIPPYVQTELMGAHQKADPRAMPLDAYIAEVMGILDAQPDVTEVVVKRCEPLRYAAERGGFDQAWRMLNEMPAGH